MFMDQDSPDKLLRLPTEQKYTLLEAAAVRLDVRIRLERFKEEDDLPPSRGGLIRLGGERVILLDKSTPLEERVQVLAQGLRRALRERGEEFGYLPPAVRLLLSATEEDPPH